VRRDILLSDVSGSTMARSTTKNERAFCCVRTNNVRNNE
jgi:hypothetical protein